MWSSMQGHLLALRHKCPHDGHAKARGHDHNFPFVAKEKGSQRCYWSRSEAREIASSKGGFGCSRSQGNQSQGSLFCTCQEHLLMERMFYKEETGMHWSTTGPFPKYLSLLVSSTPMWQSTTLTSFVEATQGKVKVQT